MKTMKKANPVLSLADINWLIDYMKLVFPTKEETTHKLDTVYTKLDSFITEIKTRREEDMLHTKQHNDIDERLEIVEKHLHITPSL